MTIKNYTIVIGPLFERNLYDQCFLRNKTATLTAILFMGLGAFLSFHEIVVSLERIQEMVVSGGGEDKHHNNGLYGEVS